MKSILISDFLSVLGVSMARSTPYKPYHAYSPASVAKAYLDQMGIITPAEKSSIPNEMLGIAMQSYCQQHPEAKSLAPDGTPCNAGTTGLLKRAHVIAGEIRYVGKETDGKWEEGDEISIWSLQRRNTGERVKFSRVRT